jgi:glycosyltransferase involved in cell wall biosynthesis
MVKVSICIPTYNGARFLRQAIDSVIEQTTPYTELIIVDDASTDETFEIALSYQDMGIKCFRNSARIGLVKNWNRCLELSQGQYINIMHQDDFMLQGNIALKTDYMDNHPTVGLVHSNIYIVNERGDIIGGHWLPDALPVDDEVQNGQSCFEKLLFAGNFICCPTVFIRRECINKLGNFDHELPYTVDYEMWLRISTHYDIGYLKKELLSYRVHNQQETKKHSGNGKEVIELFKAIRIVLDKNPALGRKFHYKQRALLRWIDHSLRMGNWHINERRPRQGIKYYISAMILLARNFI